MGLNLKQLFLSLFFILISSPALCTNYCNDASIAACYEFRTEGGSGTTLDDTGANDENGTISGADWTSTIPSGYSGIYSLQWDILNADIVTLTSDSSIELQNPLSIVAWANLTDALSIGTEKVIWGGDTGSSFFGIMVKTNNTLAVDKRYAVNVGNATTAFAEGSYVHVTFTQASDGAYVFYQDGVEDGTGTNDQTFTYNTGTINIGGDTNVLDSTWYGYLTQVATFTRQINSTEVNDIMDNSLAGATASARRIWMMDDG